MEANEKMITAAAVQAVAVMPVLQRLLQQPFSGRMAFQIGLLLAEISKEPRVAATDAARVAIIKKHGVEQDGRIAITPDHMVAFAEEFRPIAEAPLTFKVAPLPMAILDSVKELTPADAIALAPFLEA